MSKATRFTLLLAALILSGYHEISWAQETAQTKPAKLTHYQLMPRASRDGIGKLYQGREISQVMGHLGASWLERSERQNEERPDLLIDSLGIQPGQVVADIGAGSGYFTRRLAAKVGQEGRVMAVDIQPEMLEILRRNLTQSGIHNVRMILGKETSPNLPPNSVDLVLMVDVYHEFFFPHEMMTQIHSALKPGGQVVWVEYRLEDPTAPIKLLHKMSRQQVHKEATFQGFEFVRSYEGLPRQHVLFYKKSSNDVPYPNLKALNMSHPLVASCIRSCCCLLVAIVSMSWLEAQETSPENKPQVLIQTSHGEIQLELWPKAAPKTVAHFIDLAEGRKAFTDSKTGEKVTRPFYDGLIFHRIIKDFMIQGGCPLGNGSGGPGFNLQMRSTLLAWVWTP